MGWKYEIREREAESEIWNGTLGKLEGLKGEGKESQRIEEGIRGMGKGYMDTLRNMTNTNIEHP